MTSNSYALMADLHMHNWSQFASVNEQGINTRLHMLLSEVLRHAKHVHSLGGKYVVLAGDLFHVRGSVAPSVLNPVRDTLNVIGAKLGIKFVILSGNHDLEGKNSTRLGSAITALEGAHVQVINKPLYMPEIRAAFVPWIENIEELKGGIEDLQTKIREQAGVDPSGIDLILHSPVNGVIKGLPLTGLDPAWLHSLGFRNVFSGHYHNHKHFEGTNVVSIGALAHHTWSDVGSIAGAIYHNFDTGQFVHSHSHAPNFIDADKIDAKDDIELMELVSGNYVRVKAASGDKMTAEKVRAKVIEAGALGVIVQIMPAETVEERRAGVTIKRGASLEQSVAEYAQGVMKLPNHEAVSARALSILSGITVAA